MTNGATYESGSRFPQLVSVEVYQLYICSLYLYTKHLYCESNTISHNSILVSGSISIVHLGKPLFELQAFVLRVYLDSPFVPRLEMVGNLHHTEQVNLSPGWSSTILHNSVLFYTIQCDFS